MRLWMALAALGGFMSVAFGAFAAHGLEASASMQELQWLETGARYQMYHALAALAAAAFARLFPNRRGPFAWAAGFFFAGMVLFSGTLYAMAVTGISALAMLAPFGGFSYLAGWLMLAWGCARVRPATDG